MTLARAYLVSGLVVVCSITALLILTQPTTQRAPTQGCVSVDATEMYVQQQYVCGDGTQVLTFSDVTQRDAYVQVATQYGVMVIDDDDQWIRIRRG